MTTITRRMLMTGAAGLAAAAALPRWLHASAEIGGWQVDTLSDGNLVLPAEFIFGPAEGGDLAPILDRHGLTGAAQLTPPCNLTLLRGNGRVVLFDAGSGPSFQPSAGTAARGDGGARGCAGGGDGCRLHPWPPRSPVGRSRRFRRAAVYEARHYMGTGELAYWRDPRLWRRSAPRGRPSRWARRGGWTRSTGSSRPSRMATRWCRGLQAVLTPGHTPGHMSFAVAGAMILGDAIGNHHIAFEAPGLPLAPIRTWTSASRRGWRCSTGSWPMTWR